MEITSHTTYWNTEVQKSVNWKGCKSISSSRAECRKPATGVKPVQIRSSLSQKIGSGIYCFQYIFVYMLILLLTNNGYAALFILAQYAWDNI